MTRTLAQTKIDNKGINGLNSVFNHERQLNQKECQNRGHGDKYFHSSRTNPRLKFDYFITTRRGHITNVINYLEAHSSVFGKAAVDEAKKSHSIEGCLCLFIIRVDFTYKY